MPRCLSVFAVLVSVLGVLTGTVLPRPAPAQTPAGPARLLVEHNANRLYVHALYAAVVPDSATWTYDLTVERTGASTTRSRQGGSFTPTPCRVDTLSTVRLNAQPGDRLSLHLTIRRHARIVESVRRDTTLSPSE
jgi:hypothetical protein